MKNLMCITPDLENYVIKYEIMVFIMGIYVILV